MDSPPSLPLGNNAWFYTFKACLREPFWRNYDSTLHTPSASHLSLCLWLYNVAPPQANGTFVLCGSVTQPRPHLQRTHSTLRVGVCAVLRYRLYPLSLPLNLHEVATRYLAFLYTVQTHCRENRYFFLPLCVSACLVRFLSWGPPAIGRSHAATTGGCVAGPSVTHDRRVFRVSLHVLRIPSSYSIAVCLQLSVSTLEPLTATDCRIVCRKRN